MCMHCAGTYGFLPLSEGAAKLSAANEAMIRAITGVLGCIVALEVVSKYNLIFVDVDAKAY